MRDLDTSKMGPIRLDVSAEAQRRQRAADHLARHSPEDVIAASVAERRRWVLDAMIAFANDEIRRGAG